MPDCENCKKKNSEEMQTITIPIATYEKDEQRKERREKRYIFVIILLIVLFVGSNAGWLYYESQFETVSTEEYQIDQTNDGGNNNSIINGGEVFNGETDNKVQENNDTQEEAEAGQMSDLR